MALFIAATVAVVLLIPSCGERPDPLWVEVEEIAARYVTEDDAIHSLPVPEVEKERMWRESSRRRLQDLKAAYERHGRRYVDK